MIDLRQGDCLEVMKELEMGSIQLIFADLPYGTTECYWDSLIPVKPLFQEFRRLLSERGTIVLTCCFPFGFALLEGNLDLFKYDLVWQKNKVTGFANAKNKPMREHENILVFSKGTTANCSPRLMTYNPQGLVEINKTKVNSRNKKSNIGIRSNYDDNVYVQQFTNYPKTIVACNSESGLHPTQKPLALLDWVVKTYSNEGDLVLDPCFGSGTTGLACKLLNRNFIGVELDQTYFEVAKQRIESTNTPSELAS